MSDGDTQVTFVGGKAVEQTESLGSNLPDDEHAAAREAVRKAIQEAGESAAKESKSEKAKDPYKPPGTSKEPKEPKESKGDGESDGTPLRGPDGKFLPREGKPVESGAGKSPAKESGSDGDTEEEALDPSSASVKQLLKAREKVAAMKRTAKDELAKEREAIEAQRQEFARHQQELQAARQAIARERAAIEALKKDPARAVREAGWDPEQFILDLAQEGTPEGQAQRQLREMQRQIEEMKAWKAEQARQLEEAQYHAQMRQAQAHRHNAVKTFLDLGTNEEKYPHVSTFYKGREKLLVAAGDLVAEEFRNLSGGREGSYEEILDYLEDELADSAKHWYTKTYGKQTETTKEKVPVQSPKSSKGKSLNPEASGERRSLAQKDLKDLDAEERHEAAKQAVKVALAASKNSD